VGGRSQVAMVVVSSLLVFTVGLSPAGCTSTDETASSSFFDRSGDTMSRRELVAVVVRVAEERRPGLITAYAGYPGTDEDFHKTGDPDAAKAEWSGLVDGVVDYFSKSWDSSLPASRGEAAQLIWNLTTSGS
jgi:hypothetical protein